MAGIVGVLSFYRQEVALAKICTMNLECTGQATVRLLARRLFPSLVVLVLALLAAAVQAGAASPPVKVQQFTSPDQVPQGLAKSDWTSIRAAYEAGRHAFQPTATGWQARNPGQQWTTQFDRRGFLASPRDGG